MTHKSGVVPIKNTSMNLVTSDQDKAELLNDPFISVGIVDNGILPKLENCDQSSSLMLNSIYFENYTNLIKISLV